MRKTFRNIFATAIILATLILLFAMLSVPKEVYVAEATWGNATEPSGKRINNSDLISKMFLFPEHDNKNGCGLVAMGILLNFYNSLESKYQGDYLPASFNYVQLPSNDNAASAEQAKANALRDALTPITPKFFGNIGEWFGAQNATVPSGQAEGLNIYLDENCPNVNASAYCCTLPSYDSILYRLDNNIPVILTLMYYDYYDIHSVMQNTNGKKEYHAKDYNKWQSKKKKLDAIDYYIASSFNFHYWACYFIIYKYFLFCFRAVLVQGQLIIYKFSI